jgi:hypothetical protein
MTRGPCHRFGLTRADLIVVTLVLSVAVCILIPSCHKAIRKGTRQQCQNNLRQIVLAVQNYAETFGAKMPALYGAPKGQAWANGKDSRYPQSLFFAILPFMDHGTMYKAGMAGSTNGKTWLGQLPVEAGGGFLYGQGFVKTYVCDADPTNSTQQATDIGWCGSSYAANYQVFGTEDWAPKYKLDKVPDGTSNTVAIAERFAQFPGPAGQFTDPDGATQQANNLWAWPAGCPPTPPTTYTKPVPQNAAMFAYGNPDDDAVGYGKVTFNPPQADIAGFQADYRLPQSAHTGVVQVAMLDGSARGVARTVSQATWQAVVLPADGTPIGEDW